VAIDLKSDHPALRRTDDSNVVACAVEAQVTRHGAFAMTMTSKKTDRVVPFSLPLTQ
jgi:hypothetical protein